jgi:erythromycin esterase-like protein
MATRALRSVDVWRAALVGALRQWLRSHAMGFGGVDREHKRQQVEQALRLLDYAQ